MHEDERERRLREHRDRDRDPPTTATVKATDQAQIAVKPFIPPQHPKLAIVKSPKSQTLMTTLKTVKSAGGSKTTVTYGTAHFTIKVTNTGDVTLHSVNVTDPASPGCDKTIGTLVSHASKTYSCSRSTVRANFKNVATAHGTSPKGVKVEATDHANVTVRVKRPARARRVRGRQQPGQKRTSGRRHCRRPQSFRAESGYSAGFFRLSGTSTAVTWVWLAA